MRYKNHRFSEFLSHFVSLKEMVIFMKTLCVYNTRSGISKEIAEFVADKLNAEMLCVTNGKKYNGFFGYIAAAFSGLKKKLPDILPYKTRYPIEEYGRIVIVAPIWCEDVNPVMRSFLLRNKYKFKGEIYCIINHMSDISYSEKIENLCNYTGKEIANYLSLKTNKNDFLKNTEEYLNNNFKNI